MKRRTWLLTLSIGMAAAAGAGYAFSAPKGSPEAKAPAASPAVVDGALSIYFSPDGGCTDAICRDIASARRSVHVQAAQFTSKPIAKALIGARARGLDVVVITDKKKEEDDSQTARMVAAGIPVYNDGQHHTAHNKIVVIDQSLVFTGSFNFTKDSESENAENLVRIEGKPKIAEAYESNFKTHLGHSIAVGK